MTAPVYPTTPAAWLVNGTITPALTARLEHAAAVAMMRSVIERPGGLAADERTAVASVLRAQAQAARQGTIAPPAEDAFAPHQFAPALADPAACERIAAAIEANALTAPDVADAVLAFPRAVAATDAMRESIRNASLRAALGDALISDPTMDESMDASSSASADDLLAEFDDFGAIPPITPTPAPTRATLVRRAHAATVAAVTAQRESITPYIGDEPMSHRTFGVELEGFLYGGEPLERQMQRVRRALNAAGLTEWEVGTDATVIDDARQERMGLEIRSPVLRGDAGLADCINAVEALQRAGFVANDSCGIHVHIGLPTPSLAEMKTLAATLTAQEPSLDAFTSPQRRGEGNRYAMPAGVSSPYLSDHTYGVPFPEPAVEGGPAALGAALVAARGFTPVLQLLNTNGDGGRFHKVNYKSLMKRGTIEFRGRDAYLASPRELADYVRLCDRLVDRGLEGECVVAVAPDRFAAFADAITMTRAISKQEVSRVSDAADHNVAPITAAIARVSDAAGTPAAEGAGRVRDAIETAVPLPAGLVLLDEEIAATDTDQAVTPRVAGA